jgi:hypothetical protein
MISQIAPIPLASPGRTPFPGSLGFWRVQAAVWTAYGIVLTIPWIGTYTIASMAPNKLLIAGTGLLASSAVAWILRSMQTRGAGLREIVAAATVGAVIFGALWNLVIGAILGRAMVHGIGGFGGLGVIGSSGPQLSGTSYHSLVLLAWTLGFLAMSRGQTAPREEMPTLERLLARDGRKSLLLDPREIDWIEADGDYVRVHGAGRNVLLRERMIRLESALPATYVRIHRSAIVNVGRIRELVAHPNREYVVRLHDGTELKASRTYSAKLRAALGLSN